MPDFDAELREYHADIANGADEVVVKEVRYDWEGKKTSIEEMVLDACAFEIGTFMLIGKRRV